MRGQAFGASALSDHPKRIKGDQGHRGASLEEKAPLVFPQDLSYNAALLTKTIIVYKAVARVQINH